MNMGTVRYHLMILSINHRITSYKADDKYVRYFTNAGSYTLEQQLIVSLIRREGIKKVLGTLLEKPGISNLELAEELRNAGQLYNALCKRAAGQGNTNKRPDSGWQAGLYDQK